MVWEGAQSAVGSCKCQVRQELAAPAPWQLLKGPCEHRPVLGRGGKVGVCVVTLR